MKTLLLILALVVLVFSPPSAQAQKALGNWGGSDSLSAIVDSNWSTNVYTISSTNESFWLRIENLSSTAELGVAINNDTSVVSGNFSKYWRIEPSSGAVYIPLDGQKFRLRSLKSGTPGVARLNVFRKQ